MPSSAANLPDAEIVRRCLSSDDEAWRELVARHARYVHAVARAHRLSGADAEDVFQEVFARAYAKLGALRDPEALRPWLGQLTRRAAVDRLRAHAREAPETATAEPAALDPALERVELAATVRDALRALPATCQEVLDRFFAQDHSYQRIARDLGLPLGTVASRISRCLTRMRQVLEADGPPARPV